MENKELLKEYKTKQAESGIKKGDIVIVTRRAEAFEQGWNNSWSALMSQMIGKYCIVENVMDGFGVQLIPLNLNFPQCYDYNFPYYVLHKVAEGVK